MRRRFAPPLWAVIVTPIAIACFCSLGTWQVTRGQEKQALYRAFAAGTSPAVPYGSPEGQTRYAHVRLTGHYLAQQQILLDNMTHDGQVGYRVITPLQTTLGRVLVDRGWVAAPARRDVLPAIAVDGGERTLSGRLDELPRAGIALQAPDTQEWPRRLSYPDHATIERALGSPVDAGLVLLDASEDDGYVRDWHPGGLPPERHFGYAVQWYGLAFTLLVIFLTVNLKRQKLTDDPRR